MRSLFIFNSSSDRKKFITKFVIFLFSSFAIFNLAAYFLLNYFPPYYIVGNDVFKIISKSKKSSDKNIILLGDSVGRLLYSYKEYPQFENLSSNQGISMVGQYINFENAIIKNNDVKKLVLVYHPSSFRNNLDSTHTYNYFVNPYLRLDNLRYFSNDVKQKIFKKKYSLLSFLPLVKINQNMLNIDYSGSPYPNDIPFLSEISIEYLKKINEECKKSDIEFIIIQPPVIKKYDYGYFKDQIKRNGLDDIFQYYFIEIDVVPEKYFADQYHFNPDYMKLYGGAAVEKINNIINF